MFSENLLQSHDFLRRIMSQYIRCNFQKLKTTQSVILGLILYLILIRNIFFSCRMLITSVIRKSFNLKCSVLVVVKMDGWYGVTW